MKTEQNKTKIRLSLIADYCAYHVRFSEASWRRISAALAKAGFDQVPTGSNWSCDTNFDGLAKFCDARCSKERIKGYMMAPWLASLEKYEAKALEAVVQMSATIKARKA